ncbi:alpha-1,2-mannosyltransferase ALG9 [Anopheles ziemanni]|uniref:alpha-1,2-mannosyltransferase ALG9 n=1 Tax=Anopheles coustani TaxID=139045 RepID=UPI00265B1F4F|nr:alpha-1,2-mannosyltransferase ALG9 [Anopheles coustani]XP_058168980.1 alpha-1,2-mannosyltransferase ALG9 [Anopheles ziemanni]
MMAFRANTVAIFMLLLVRLQAALWSIISDCDETYNYWEPLHYLWKGRGFQTWEYSPEFGLRSYSYLWLHALPATILGFWVENGVVIFYFLRCLLALVCATLEYRFYKTIKQKCGASVGNMFLCFQLICPGMFISSAALLPSSFAMYVTIATMTAWMNGDVKTVIAITAFSGLIGWPFAVIVSIPFVLELLVKDKKLGFFMKNAIFFGLLFAIPIVLIDSAYFGRLTMAALNIVRYNVFTSHGPDLYGVEPASFYFKNLFLNHNVAFFLALLYPVGVLISKAFGMKSAKSRLSHTGALWKLSPLFLWLAVFVVQPHKEERFVFPVYPLFSMGSAFFLDIVFNTFDRYRRVKMILSLKRMLSLAVIVTALLLSLSRIIAVCINYRAPMIILNGLEQTKHDVNLCYGKEWYRFPGSFFVPDNYRVRFIPSSFTGMLPAYYSETENGTKLVHNYFNDLNVGNSHMLFPLDRCDFLVDLDTGENYDSRDPEPNYSADGVQWAVIKSVDFVIASRTNTFARAFYAPFFSSRYRVMGKYNLLKRKKIKHVI